jgi:hypothetical protein
MSRVSRRPLFFLVSFSFFFFLFFISRTQAAYLYLDPLESTLLRGDSGIVTIRIDTDEGECINTVDVTLEYDEGIRPVDVSSGDSILSVWLEAPTIHEDTRTITFAGGIPGGYCGRAIGDPGLSNTLASIVFQSPGFAIGGTENTVPQIRFRDTTRVLENDGLGTEAVLRTDTGTITLQDEPGSSLENVWAREVSEDNEAPADFVITLSQTPNAFSNQYFITWASTDKQTGIDHYEVMEEPLEDLYAFEWGRQDAPWKKAESPYLLVDQSLNSTIRVKAIDKAGNETIAVLVPDQALRTLSENRVITLLVVSVIALLSFAVVAYVLIERRRRILSKLTEDENV